MAILWFDGFNDGPNSIALRYTLSGAVTMAVNPLTGRAAVLTDASTITREAAFSDTTCVIGFAFRADTAPTTGIFTLVRVMEGATTHVRLAYDAASQTLRLYRGDGTLLGSGSIALPDPDQSYLSWRYVELKVTVADSGSAEVRINDVADITLPSTDTRNGGTGQPDAIQLGSSGSSSQSFCYDDLYVLDGAGIKSTFLGQYTTISPTTVQSEGNYTQWSPSAGTNSTCVSEADENADTDYVESADRGSLDTYTTSTFLGTPTVIHAVSVTSVARSLTTPIEMCNVVLHGGVEAQGSTVTTTTSYAAYVATYEQDPYTLLDWTSYDISQLQIGVEDSPGDFERFVTSRPYPIDGLDEMSVGIGLVGGSIYSWPLDEMAVGTDLSSGSLYVLSSTHSQPYEAMDMSLDLTSGDLTVLLITQAQPYEAVDTSVDLSSGTLEVKLINYTFYPAEAIDIGVTLTSGTLS